MTYHLVASHRQPLVHYLISQLFSITLIVFNHTQMKWHIISLFLEKWTFQIVKQSRFSTRYFQHPVLMVTSARQNTTRAQFPQIMISCFTMILSVLSHITNGFNYIIDWQFNFYMRICVPLYPRLHNAILGVNLLQKQPFPPSDYGSY